MTCVSVFFFNDTATTEIYTLSLHDALPILSGTPRARLPPSSRWCPRSPSWCPDSPPFVRGRPLGYARHSLTVMRAVDRKSTRLNSSHANISYAVFCLKKKKNTHYPQIEEHY